ncbi:MAG: InlB B-repeat-containing protein, partial [Treponema sp.]|nr:InlB B-repeat-containing protein [Treponema sp.]
MPYSIFKQRILQFFTLLLSLLTIVNFSSCSLLDSKNESGKILFSLDDSLVRAILADSSESDGPSIENPDVSESAREIFIEILGNEEKALASKSLPLDSGQTALFEDLPLDVKVYARAVIYRSGEDSSYADFAGVSEEITIQEGENHLALNLDKYCLVKFDSLGGTKVESLEVKKGQLFSAPESLERESSENGTSYTFDGWYTSEDSGLTLSEKYDFASPVTK